MLKTLLLALLIILIVVVGWQFAFPILGGIVAISAVAWGLTVASIVIFCTAILLLFIFTGIGALFVGAPLFVWTVIAIILFPILFPIMLPLFILFLFVALLRRKSNPEQQNKEWDNK